MVESLLHAIPGIASITGLLALLYYVFAVMATGLFGAAHPAWFGTIGKSMYTLFQIMTLESWSMGIARPVMETPPSAWPFFIPFILIATFTILNLFIAIIVNSMQTMHDRTRMQEQAAIEDSVAQ
jgi:voltage-gated sodium channel